MANVLQAILHKILLITEVKIFRHCITNNFSKDYFRQQYQRECHEGQSSSKPLQGIGFKIKVFEIWRSPDKSNFCSLWAEREGSPHIVQPPPTTFTQQEIQRLKRASNGVDKSQTISPCPI